MGSDKLHILTQIAYYHFQFIHIHCSAEQNRVSGKNERADYHSPYSEHFRFCRPFRSLYQQHLLFGTKTLFFWYKIIIRMYQEHYLFGTKQSFGCTKNIIFLVQNNHSDVPKTLSFWYKIIIRMYQNHYLVGTGHSIMSEFVSLAPSAITCATVLPCLAAIFAIVSSVKSPRPACPRFFRRPPLSCRLPNSTRQAPCAPAIRPPVFALIMIGTNFDVCQKICIGEK